MLVFDAPLTLLALLPVPIAMGLAWASGRWIRERTTASRKVSSALTAALQDHLSGIRVVRLLGMKDAAQGRIERLAAEQARTNLNVAKIRAALPAAYTTLMTAGVVLVIWQGGSRVVAGAWTLGAFVAYLDLFLRFTGRGFRVPQLVNSVQAGSAAYVRLQPLLAPALPANQEPRFASFHADYLAGGQIQAPSAQTAQHTRGALSISLQNVTFTHGTTGAPALTNISLEIPAGAFVAVTGPVGSGKSALAKALLGLYPLAGGCVKLNGDPPSHHIGKIGYLPQEPFLFSGSVRENIAFGDAQADARAAHGITIAALSEDLLAFPLGLETEIGERGILVSGGQRQRIALARAVALSPRLLVLDDPFSAVDVNTEAQIISRLHAAFGSSAQPDQRATIVLCSHRLAAFPQADLVVVLNEGCIAEQGTHTELIEASSMYASIYKAQTALAEAVQP